MTIFHSIVLGLIEGLTEFLPISSTAHLILVSKLLAIPESSALTVFQIAVQVGAIAAVVVVYFKKFFDIKLLTKLTTAFIPTGIAGILIYPHLKTLFTNPWIIVVTLFFGGIIILITENWYKKKFSPAAQVSAREVITWKDALILGLFQAIAIVPGTSRSGSTIVGGLLLGLKRSVVTEFTFLLAVPTMIIATLYTVYKNYSIFENVETLSPIIMGTLVSFFVALVVIKTFLTYIKTKPFTIFGWYRIALAIVIALVLI